ncbi:MAG: oligoendopeptidase F [Bacilli bacterium]|nr:oligoendopeptidase F [Bacilli bacterium]
MKKRSEIENKYKIDTTSLFKDNNEFELALKEIENDINKISKFAGKLMDKDNLYEVLSLDENLVRRLYRLYTYAHINNDVELSINLYNEYVSKVLFFYNKYSSLSSYIVPELLENEYSVIEEKIKKDLRLKDYELSLKKIFRLKEHTLNKQEEFIISKLTTPYEAIENAYSKLKDVDLKFEKINVNGKRQELNPILYYALQENPDRKIRKDSFKKFYKGYESIINTNAELISGNVKKNNAISEVRKFNSALERALITNEIDPKVYDTLLNSINKNIYIIHKQWDVYFKALNISDPHIYDVGCPVISDYEKIYTYEEACKLILDSISVMGDEYKRIFKRAMDERWIDVFPNENKRSGGYCTNCYETHPYVVINFDGRIHEVSTITHELGHAMQYYYASKYNNFSNSDYSIFVAEVASQVNEILLNLYIINNSKDINEIKTIYANLIKQFKGSVVRQSMFAEFEKTIHESDQKGIPLSVDYLNKTYLKLNKKYYGKHIKVDKQIMYEWSRIPHFYYNFYVYQYATGYIAALKIATDLYNKKENSLENYIKFLKLGSTLDPVESLKVAGVDLTKEESFDAAFKMFDRQLDEFQKLTDKEV